MIAIESEENANLYSVLAAAGRFQASNRRTRERMPLRLADCPVRTTIDVIRGKWKSIIITALESNSLCYGELRRVMSEVTKKVLAQQLRELEKEGIVSRNVLLDHTIRVSYSLSEYGRTLVPVLKSMHEWGKKHRERAWRVKAIRQEEPIRGDDLDEEK